jgi:hypothetical protein
LLVERGGGGGKGVCTRDQLLILVKRVLVYGLHCELVHVGRHPGVDEAGKVWQNSPSAKCSRARHRRRTELRVAVSC